MRVYGIMLFAFVFGFTVSSLAYINSHVKNAGNYEDIRECSEDEVKNDIGELFDRRKDYM